MTIGIGILCSSKPKPHEPRPDALVLIADTMGSTTTDSTDELHKVWIDDSLRLYAVAAGNMEYGSEVFSAITQEVAALPKRTHGTISGALNKAFQGCRGQHFQWDIAWSRLSIPTSSGNLQLVGPDVVQQEWQKFWLDLHMLVGTFDHQGQAHLYLVGQFDDERGQQSSKVVHLCEFPGYAVIGTGSANAAFWLNYRRQALGLNVKRTAYHAYEAKVMAAKAPTVNDAIEMVIVLPNQNAFHLTEAKPQVDGCLTSLKELRALFRRFGPRTTAKIGGEVKPLAARKSAGSQ